MGPLRPPRRTETRPRRADGRAGGGYSLVEVIIAMLMTSIIVTSVFSTAVTTKAASGKSDRKLAASQGAKMVTAMLKNYVTGCDCNITTGNCDATSCPASFPGPGAAGSWSMTNLSATPQILDTCSANCAAAAATCYAFKTGSHCVAGLLPAWFEAAPFSARVSYVVDPPAPAGRTQIVDGRPMPYVTVTVNWTEP